MKDQIVITAPGVLSSLGKGSKDSLEALISGQAGLRNPQHLQTIHANDYVVGEVTYSNDDLALMLGLPTGDNGYTRTTLLALNAMQDLFSHTDIESLRNCKLAIINANTIGGICAVEHQYIDFIAPGKTGDFIKYIETLDCAESTEQIASFFGLKPLTATISTACSSSANAIILGARMIRHGLVDKAICGGCDALSRFTFNGFNSLKNVDKNPCRPFDQNRGGLNLGEGAGYLLLEKEEDAKARGAEILAYFTGYHNSNDAYHPTAPSPDGAGAYRTMEKALQMAGLSPRDIQYINTHGTATQNNDISEGLAIERLFNGNSPHFNSTKAYTGHTLAAAGVIESIFTILSLKHRILFPNLHYETPMDELTIRPVTSVIENADLQNVMSNSFGFGGSNVSLIFSK